MELINSISTGDIVTIDPEFIHRTKRKFNSKQEWIVSEIYDSLCGSNIVSIKNKKTGEYVSLPEYDLIKKSYDKQNK